MSSKLELGNWIESLRGTRVGIPSINDLRTEMKKKYGEILFAGKMESAVTESPLRIRFLLPALVKRQELYIQQVRGFVPLEHVEGFDEELVTGDLTQKNQRKYNDCFIINPPLKALREYGDLTLDEDNYGCNVRFTSLGKIVTLEMPERPPIQITSDNF